MPGQARQTGRQARTAGPRWRRDLPWFTRACVDGDSSVFRGSKPVMFVKCTRRSDEGSIDLIGLVWETWSIMEAIG